MSLALPLHFYFSSRPSFGSGEIQLDDVNSFLLLRAQLLDAHNYHQPGVPPRKAPSLIDVEKLAKFVDPLPRLGITKPVGTRADPENPKERLPFYRVSMRETSVKVHRDLPETRMWGYGGN